LQNLRTTGSNPHAKASTAISKTSAFEKAFRFLENITYTKI